MASRGMLTYGGIEVNNPGVQGVMSRTLPNRFLAGGSGRLPANAASNERPGGMMNRGYDEGEEHPAGGNPLVAWVVGLVAVIALHWFLQKSEGANILGFNVANIFLLGLYAALSIAAYKVVFTKVQVPGLTQVFQAV